MSMDNLPRFEQVMGRRKAAGSIHERSRHDTVEAWERRPMREPERSAMMARKSDEGDQHYVQLRSDVEGQPIVNGKNVKWTKDGKKAPVLKVAGENHYDHDTHSTQPRRFFTFGPGRPVALAFKHAASLLYRYGEYLEEVFPEENG
ncbi:MAG: hypothetical protein IMF05_03010 [Proteobacteria bacterium]|nr:hypothetical protein [Pseudomonadota bacterium]